VGIVYQPDWFPGFSASVDYYRIGLKGQINNLSSANIIELCRLGFLNQCANIITNPAGQTVFNNPNAVWRQVVSAAFNLAETVTDGFDFETSYRFSLDDQGIPGDWTLRLLATHVSKFISATGLPGTIPHESAGENGGSIPHWKVLATQSYQADRWSISFTERYISDGRQNTQYVVCTPGSCPLSTSNYPTINSNGLRGQFLLDIGGTFNIDDHWQVFGKVDNVGNADPVMIYSNAPNNANGVNPSLYDVIGRMYHVGVRLKM
jgi:outer membrane receptor protein involved in Fe transport